MYQDAKLNWEAAERKRAAEMQQYIAAQDQYEKRWAKTAQTKFETTEGLEDAIKIEILPCLFQTRRAGGIVGSGFFRHGEWPVSNAHVIPSQEALAVTQFFDLSGNAIDLQLERSFHRPSSDSAPDVVVMKINIAGGRSFKSFGIGFMDGSSVYPQRHTFYVWNGKIHYLMKVSREGAHPFVYVCGDGEAMPGSSGSAIIEAALTQGNSAKWLFRVVGVLYGRCQAGSAWVRKNVNTAELKKESALVCAIPIDQEFNQILHEVIHPEGDADRSGQCAVATAALKDKADAASMQRHYTARAQEKQVAAQQGLQEFEEGMSSLDIDLPEGLEKLLGKAIISFEDSVLTGEAALKRWGFNKQKIEKVTKKPKRFPSVSVKELQEDFEGLLEKIREIPKMPMSPGNNAYPSPKEHFRGDILGAGDGEFWRLEIQDNTDAWYHRQSPSLSSTFAIAIYPKGQKVSGAAIAELLEKSRETKQAEKFHVSASSAKNVDKQASRTQDPKLARAQAFLAAKQRAETDRKDSSEEAGAEGPA